MSSDSSPPATSESAPDSSGENSARPRIKIGSQRTGVTRIPPPFAQPETLRPPIAPVAAPTPAPASPGAVAAPPSGAPTASAEGTSWGLTTAAADVAPAPPLGAQGLPPAAPSTGAQVGGGSPLATQPPADEGEQPRERGKKGSKRPRAIAPEPLSRTVEVPNVRAALSPELEAELAEALGEGTLDSLLEGSATAAATGEVPLDSRRRGRVHSSHGDLVFVDLGGRHQGTLPLAQFPEPPVEGFELEVIVRGFDADEGLYQLSVPGGTVDIADWSQVEEGLVVEARITGHNKGGLECEVSRIRGFIPAGQVSLYRVEDFSQFVGERWACVVTEASPHKRNLVLSRRAVLEREQAAAKQQLLAELAPGQTREGLVRNIRDFGAFVDLGGVDGLLHVSQLGWHRVKHPSEVLEVGQKVRVKVQKIDPETGKISLSLRDLIENPWTQAGFKYPVGSRVRGTVTKLMDFGAFVEIEPGIEGLVHISELDHKRVFRVGDVVAPGQAVEAKVLSIDPEGQRMSLSIKAVQARPEAAPAAADEPESEEPAPPPRKAAPVDLKGGIGRGSGGEKFGLRW